MASASAHRKNLADKPTLYQDITDKIIAELEAGCVPWVQPWGSSGINAALGLPKNAATGRQYSGINILILWSAVAERGFTGQRWLTFRQALALGGNVRKGEKGTTVVYADRFVPDGERTRAADAGEEPEAIPFLKRFTVFNTDQCADLPADADTAAPPPPEHLILPQAEALIRATGADLRIGGDRAFYVPSADYIQVPPPSAYFEPVNWHRTACHELGHWTGAEALRSSLNDLGNTPADRLLEAERQALDLGWLSLPPVEGFAALSALPPEAKQRLFAWCIAATLNGQLAVEDRPNPVVEHATRRLAVPFADYWRPTAANYWGRVKKAHGLEVARALLGPRWARDHADDKKPILAAALEVAFDPAANSACIGLDQAALDSATAWLPPGFACTPGFNDADSSASGEAAADEVAPVEDEIIEGADLPAFLTDDEPHQAVANGAAMS